MLVLVIPTERDVEAARDALADLAFDAATGLGQVEGIEIASDDWQRLYDEILVQYKEASRYMLYYLHLAITSVKIQIENGLLRLMVPSVTDTPSPSEISYAIVQAAKPLAACLLHVASVGDKLLIPDDEIHQLSDDVLALAVGVIVNDTETKKIGGTINE